jgi:valyl-tRNA synthetase
MDTQFDPKSYEQSWQERWAQAGYFQVEAQVEGAQVADEVKVEGGGAPAFCIMIPPPNVTGKLHMGHALQSALQDLLTRWHRMRGERALWLPGSDHAGIATQMMVERQLAAEGTSRVELGRERFEQRVWEWKHEHRDNIRRQLDLLGASCDWSRERFTLDEGLSQAVRHAFVTLYRDGLISRGDYMVNWSPELDTAVSDLEVEMKTVQGKLYHLAYPVEGSDERIVVATTRPETMLGDTGVAFHPDDPRYQHLRGKAAILPLVGRRIPFVPDEVVDPEFGTGLVKVTPAHDPNDFEIGRRHDLPQVQVISHRGTMTDQAGEFAGLDRFEARRQVVERLEREGFLVKVEEHVHNVGHCQRSGVPIEPLVSTQWFCDVSAMAERALAAVRDGDLELVPDLWSKTWDHWLENIKPWCISRQLWWGHRIPAWYSDDGRVFVAESEAEARRQAGAALAADAALRQDPDVLDTWFSSALWPFSTLGWPEKTPDMATFYPTDVLITGYDILFFWVARMTMFGLYFTDQSPFKTVHLTQLIRAEDGQKMSKTKGNAVDPTELVEEYGADAVRFYLIAMDTPGRDINLNREQIAGYRAFGNKIWNAARFALSKVEGAAVPVTLDPAGLAAPERWILSRLSATAAEVHDKLASYRFDEACHRLYHFFWHELCDWYLELTKPAFAGEAPRPRVAEVTLAVLDRSLRLLHPAMPFLTEELWQRLPGHEAIHPQTLVLAPYPQAEAGWQAPEIETQMDAVLELITRLRGMRADLGIVPKDRPRLYWGTDDAELGAFVREQMPLIRFLGRLGEATEGRAPSGASTDLVAGIRLALELAGRDLAAEERERLQAELVKVEGEMRGIEGRLGNPAFVNKAPEHVVAGNRTRLAELQERRERIQSGMAAVAPTA